MNPVIDHLTQGTLEVTGRLVDASNATLYAQCTERTRQTTGIDYR